MYKTLGAAVLLAATIAFITGIKHADATPTTGLTLPR